MTNTIPVVGIGACLVGLPVRYNGDSKRKNPHIESLKDHLQLNSFCPEIAIGMGVPRETVRLVGDIANTRLMDSDTQSKDYTEPMQAYALSVYSNNPNMAGYILVKGSPSCGFERVKRYNDKGNPLASDAMGVFAAALNSCDPLLPMEEDGRLNDHQLRENFVTRVYAYHQWKQLLASGLSHHALIDFWARHKYLVMAHSISHYQSLGRLLANARRASLQSIAADFITELMAALKSPATRKSHSNVLEHIRGYLKKQLNSTDKRELDGLIAQYRAGVIPLIVPMTLLKHHFKRHQHAYIDQQVFLAPYPETLGLRNHV
jgi:uncharacterized protein YbgA (DUF1722 family)/uncharacterized protein YbbK (DUF523 family)